MPGPLLEKLLRHARRLLDRGPDPEPDAALLERFARRPDEDAFAELMARHAPAVWGVCRGVLPDEADAEDAFQETFLVLARKARQVRKAVSVGSWLYGVAYRVARKARSRAARRTAALAATGEPAATAPDPCADLAWRELRALRDEELTRLPDVLRAPLLLCYFEGCTQDEAARRLGWKKRTLKARVERGRRTLRARLSRRGVELPAALAVPLLGSAVAAVPPRLTADLAAATACISRSQPPAAISDAALTLAEGATAAMTAKKYAVVLAAACAAALVGVGAGRVLRQPDSAKPSAPPLASVADEPADTPRVDLHGDPLPAGAVARLGTLRWRHEGEAHSVAFSADGKIVAASNGRGRLSFWDSATGKPLPRRPTVPGTGPYLPPPEEIASVVGFDVTMALSPDGKTVALGTVYRKLRLWDTSTGKEITEEPNAHDADSRGRVFPGRPLAGHRRREPKDLSLGPGDRPADPSGSGAATAPAR